MGNVMDLLAPRHKPWMRCWGITRAGERCKCIGGVQRGNRYYCVEHDPKDIRTHPQYEQLVKELTGGDHGKDE